MRTPALSALPSLPALLVLAAAAASPARADVEPHPAMLRYPDVSASHIVFVYANDLWMVPREGGTATPLASPPGPEQFPRFSPDGRAIAFMGNYDGNRDLYTLPVTGGIPTRVTYHPAAENLTDWSPDGTSLMYFASGMVTIPRQTQLFTVPAAGGLFTQVPVPYGANGALSADGTWLAYTPHTTDTRTWKRYRGGMATDVWLFNLRDKTSRRVTDWEGTDSQPMWHGPNLYYLSDRGPEHRLNIWRFDPAGGTHTQVTKLDDYDVKWPAVGPGPSGGGEIVFQHGARLMLLDLPTGKARAVEVSIPGARPTLRPQAVDASKFIAGGSISPGAKRVAVEARGDIWTLPAEKGSPRNLTRTSGAFERDPAWSPDGRWIAHFSDESGEYELYLRQSDGKGQARRLTTDNGPFKYSPTWAPDSKSLVFWDKAGTSFLHVLATEEVKDKDGAVTTPAKPAETRKIDTDPWGSRRPMSFSHDGRWLAYARGHEDARGSSNLWVYDTRSGERHQLTSGMFDDSDPAFDRKGEFLYFVSSRNFRPIYSELDTTFIYNGSEVVLAVPLRADVKSPFLPVSDEETWKGKPGEKKDEEKKDGEKKEGDKDEADKKDDADKEDPEKKGEPGKPDPGKEDDGDKPDEPDDAEKKPAAEPVKDDGVSGTWAGKATGPEPVPAEGFPFTLKLTLNADGTVSGTMTSAIFTGAVTGSYDAATRALTLNLSIGATPVTITLTIDGPRMSGSATVEGRTYQLSAERTAPAGQDVADPEKEKPKSKDVVIDLAGFERRAIQIPIKPGNFGGLAVNDKGHLVFARLPVGGEGTAAVKVFDPKDEKKEEKEIASGTAAFELTPDGKKILLARGQSYTIQDASAGSAAAAKSVPTTGMTAMINPREEWRQILNDAWRIQRDFFYVANMHGVDWPAVKEQYARMLADCATREDVAYVLAEMISELNVGHAYVTSPGDVQQQPTVPIGTLGCDFELVPAAEGLPAAYRITRIYRGADWDSDAQGPLSQPGVDVKEGDFLLAINGVPLDTARDPWAALQGMAGRTVTLTVSQKQLLDDAAREAVVECAGSESNLRYRAWIEAKRAYVDQKSGGTVGYIYVPNTGIDGQSDLFRQFYGQVGKQALIIDERWNGGGQIPTRFIELLNRPATNYWARRDGKDWTWPPDSHQGPKCMLINGLAGSGGDMFPALFKQNKIGPTIGTRTWGGLVGISGNPGLIDGGYVSVPTFGFYEKDGTWGIEGHGVDPDVEVVDDPALMVDGGDPQLDKAIQLMTQAIKTNGYTPPKRPADPDRRGMGIRDEDR